MEDLKKCNNGHYYDKNLPRCPYCPSNSTKKSPFAKDLNETEISYNERGSMGAESANVNNPGDSDTLIETEMAYGVNETLRENSEVDLSRTYIQEVDEYKPDGNSGEEVKPRLNRRLVGWIVSYTIDSMGVDYQIFEGRNTIGTDSRNNITLAHDVAISSHHLTILYRSGKFSAKDELSSNGTFVNDKEVEPDEVAILKDGDNVRIGETIFIFKTPL
jgi:FHA domain